MKGPSKLFMFGFVFLVLSISFFTAIGLDWYSDHTLDGVLGQIQRKGFTVGGFKYMPIDLFPPQFEAHNLAGFLYLLRTYGWYSISFHSYMNIVYWEPFYDGSTNSIFYSIWFNNLNGTLGFRYLYNPAMGTGDM